MSNRAQRRHPEQGVATRQADKPVPRHDVFPPTAIAWMHPGKTAGEFTELVFDMAVYDGAHQGILRSGGSIRMQSSPRLATARCGIVREFLKMDPATEYLGFFDADMAGNGDSLYRMIASAKAHQADILGGLCFVGGRGTKDMYPTIYMLDPDEERAKNLSVVRVSHYPKGAIVGCDATGGAAMLIHRRVLVKMGQAFARRGDGLANPTPWFADGVHAGQEYGEDVVFCLRARQLGFKVAVDTNIKFGHVKEYVLDEDLYELHLALTGQKPLKLASDRPEEEGFFDVSGPIRDQSIPAAVIEPEPEEESRCSCEGSTEGPTPHRDDCPEWPGQMMGQRGAVGVH